MHDSVAQQAFMSGMLFGMFVMLVAWLIISYAIRERQRRVRVRRRRE